MWLFLRAVGLIIEKVVLPVIIIVLNLLIKVRFFELVSNCKVVYLKEFLKNKP